jgi:hypothetical protein
LAVVSLAGGCAEYGGCRGDWGYSGCGRFEGGDPLEAAVVGGFVLIVLIADALGRACHGCR